MLHNNVVFENIQLSWIFFCHNFVSFLQFLLLYTLHTILYHTSSILYLVSNSIDILFPKHCIVCRQQGEYLCKNCKKQLKPHPEICPYCHRFSADYKTCINCRTQKNNYLEGIIIPFVYTANIKSLIIKLKYFHKKDISNFLIDRLIIALQANKGFESSIPHTQYSTKKLVISFIPSHRYRHYFIKGYNQSQLLAKKLSEKLYIPMIAIANKKRHTKTQASLDRNGRLHNLKNAFSLTKNLQLQGNETLLIIDDITTTGSTINELAKLIKNQYPNTRVR